MIAGAVGYWAFDNAVLWATYHAFGLSPPLTVLLMGYLIGQLGGLIPIPGGIGGIDGGLIGTSDPLRSPGSRYRRGRLRLPADPLLAAPHPRGDRLLLVAPGHARPRRVRLLRAGDRRTNGLTAPPDRGRRRLSMFVAALLVLPAAASASVALAARSPVWRRSRGLRAPVLPGPLKKASAKPSIWPGWERPTGYTRSARCSHRMAGVSMSMAPSRLRCDPMEHDLWATDRSLLPRPSGTAHEHAGIIPYGNPSTEDDSNAFANGTGQFAEMSGAASFDTSSAGARSRGTLSRDPWRITGHRRRSLNAAVSASYGSTAYSRHSPGAPFNECVPRSSNCQADPTTRSLTVLETST